MSQSEKSRANADGEIIEDGSRRARSSGSFAERTRRLRFGHRRLRAEKHGLHDSARPLGSRNVVQRFQSFYSSDRTTRRRSDGIDRHGHETARHVHRSTAQFCRRSFLHSRRTVDRRLPSNLRSIGSTGENGGKSNFFFTSSDRAFQWIEIKEKLFQALDLADSPAIVRNHVIARYWLSHQRFFKYLCIACKVPKVVELARQAVRNGKVRRRRSSVLNA